MLMATPHRCCIVFVHCLSFPSSRARLLAAYRFEEWASQCVGKTVQEALKEKAYYILWLCNMSSSPDKFVFSFPKHEYCYIALREMEKLGAVGIITGGLAETSRNNAETSQRGHWVVKLHPDIHKQYKVNSSYLSNPHSHLQPPPPIPALS